MIYNEAYKLLDDNTGMWLDDSNIVILKRPLELLKPTHETSQFKVLPKILQELIQKQNIKEIKFYEHLIMFNLLDQSISLNFGLTPYALVSANWELIHTDNLNQLIP